MRRQSIGGAAAFALAALVLAGALPGGAAETPTVRLIIGLDRVPDGLAEGHDFHGAPVVAVDSTIHFVVVETRAPLDVEARARADHRVRYVEEAPLLQWIEEATSSEVGPSFIPNDPAYATQQYGPQQIRADLAWDTTLGSTAAAVCVVDTGVRHTHEDLTGTRWLGGRDVVNNDNDPMDDNGHGTHVAGTAAATIHNARGMAGVGNVGIYGVKVLNAQGSGTFDQVATGITWCADNTMARTVISMSLGGSTGSTALQDAVRYAADTKGKLVVAAAGNSGPCSNCIGYPAKYAEVVAVTCTTSTESLCSFSSTGPEAEVAAPGNQIYSTYHTSNTAYTTLSGTSMSTPHVSGAAALVWSHLTGLTNAQLRSRLQDTSVDLGSAGRDAQFGYGRLDAKCLLDDTSPCGAPPPPPGCDTPGPDTFGYRCEVVPFDFQDISATGASIPLGDDQVSAAIPLGFAFTFYGAPSTSAHVSSNGFLTFSAGQPDGCCSGQVLPDAAAPNHLVAGYWEDLYPPGGGTIKHQTIGSAPGRTFLVQWTDVPHFIAGNPVTFQVALLEGSNLVEVHLGSAPSDGGQHATGIENGAGTVGLRYKAGSYSPASTGVRFTPPGSAAPPTTTASLSGAPGNQGWWRSAVSVSLSCTPPSGASCTGTSYRVDGGAWQAYAGPFSVAGDGAHAVDYFSTASNGATETTRSASVPIDATPPTVGATAACSLPGDAGWCRGAVTTTTSASDGGSGLASQSCTLDSAPASCGSAAVSAQGTHTSSVSATDVAGNSASASATFRIDSVAPSLQGARQPPPNAHGWANSAVTVGWTCTDATSGVAATPPSVVVATEGANQARSASCADRAGNTASATVGGISIDLTAPGIALPSRTPGPNPEGWNNADVTLGWTCTDALSGVASAPASQVVGSEGAGQSRTASCADRAGNSASSTIGDINIDKTAPALSGTRSPAPNANGWNNGPVTVGWTCTDALSGVASAPTSQVLGSEGAGQARSASCADRAGNSASHTVGAISIDLTAPGIALPSRTPGPNAHGWNRGDVVLAWACSDVLSGPVAASVSATVTGEGAALGATGACEDRAGNRATHGVGDVRIDRTAPSLAGSRSPEPNEHGWNNGPVTVSWACADALSGVASVSAPQTLAAEGASLSASGSCSDLADNPASTTAAGIRIDRTAPSLAGRRSPAPNGFGWAGEPVTVSWLCSDALSGVASVSPGEVLASEGSNQSASGACADLAGNAAAAALGSISVDLTPPGIALTERTPPNAHGWNDRGVTVRWTCSDALSGPLAASVAASLGAEGAGQTASGACEDRAGHRAAASEGGIHIDLTRPAIALGSRTAANAHGWNRGPVEVAWDCSDALSGPAEPRVGATVAGEGAGQSATGTCQDLAGNTARHSLGNIHIDLTPPGTALASRTPPNPHGWNNGPVSVSWACSDALSGPAEPRVGTTLRDEGADQSATGTCADLADNTASATEGGIHIDLTPPQLGVGLDGLPGNAGWWRSNLMATLACEDALSGVPEGGITYVLDGAAATYAKPFPVRGDGRHDLAVACTDAAENLDGEARVVRIDTTPPRGVVLSPTLAVGPYSATWSSFDAASGVALVEVAELALLGVLEPDDALACSAQLTGRAGANVTGDCARDPEPGHYCYRVLVEDVAGNRYEGPAVNLSDAASLAGALPRRCTAKLAPPEAPALRELAVREELA